MMNENDIFWKIEDYLRGKLSKKEKIAFEEKIAKDASLKEQVDMQRLEHEGMDLLIEKDLRTDMANWETDWEMQKKVDKFNWRKWLPFFILLFIGFTGWLIYSPFQSNEPIPDSIFQEEVPPVIPEIKKEVPLRKEVEPKQDEQKEKTPIIANEDKKKATNSIEKIIKTPKSNNAKYLALATRKDIYELPNNLQINLKSNTSSDNASALNLGIQAFKAEDFSTAIKTFQAIDKAKNLSEYETSREWLAHAYLKEGNFPKAVKIFESTLSTATLNVKDRMEWYLTLSLFGDYNQNKVKIDALLDNISKDEYHDYYQNAIDLQLKLAPLQ